MKPYDYPTEEEIKEHLGWMTDPVDPKPMAIPIDLQKPESMDEKIKRILQTEISLKAARSGAESWDEAHDFDVEDDFDKLDPTSKYEIMEMKDEFPEHLKNLDKEMEKNQYQDKGEDENVQNTANESVGNQDKGDISAKNEPDSENREK